MLTICRCGHPDPRPPSPSPSFVGRTRHRARPKSTGRQAARDGTFKKVLVLGRGRSCCSPSQRQDGGGEGSRASGGKVGPRGCGAESPRRDPGAAVGKGSRAPAAWGEGVPGCPRGGPQRSPRSEESLTWTAGRA